MPTIWEYIHLGRTDSNSSSYPQHNLQEGLLQIASQTCNILVQVNNTNNISYGNNATNVQYNSFEGKPSCSRSSASSFPKDTGNNASSSSNSKKTTFDLEEQSVVLLQPTDDSASSTKNNKNSKNIFSNYRHRLSVSIHIYVIYIKKNEV